MTALADLVRSFAALLKPAAGNDVKLTEWIAAARAVDLPHLRSLTNGLEIDRPAVDAGLTLPYGKDRVDRSPVGQAEAQSVGGAVGEAGDGDPVAVYCEVVEDAGHGVLHAGRVLAECAVRDGIPGDLFGAGGQEQNLAPRGFRAQQGQYVARYAGGSVEGDQQRRHAPVGQEGWYVEEGGFGGGVEPAQACTERSMKGRGGLDGQGAVSESGGSGEHGSSVRQWLRRRARAPRRGTEGVRWRAPVAGRGAPPVLRREGGASLVGDGAPAGGAGTESRRHVR
ncbi:hypothetical protein [Streptomyces sp. NBC_01450]|uniref:hypothetical protein n=1 Tax=Streptomyces sp. NBC_01450 TaxID=2903871 RepID=UPI003FCE6B16